MAVLFGSFAFLIIIGCPIVYSLGISGFIGLVAMGGVPLQLMPQRMLTAVDSYTLLAIPLFMLAGRLMSTGGVARRIFHFSECLVGHITGGLGHVNVLASMFFGGMSGSAVADAAGLGAIEVPAMLERGYDLDFSAAITGASSTMGPIIPPSIPMIVYGATAGISIAKLFLAGALPGVLMGILLMIYVYFVSKKRKYPVLKRATLPEVWKSFKDSFLALLTPLIIMGGILGGVFTATEASVVAAIYTLLISIFAYKEFNIKDLPKILAEVAVDTATVALIMGTASIAAWLLSVYQVPSLVVNAITSVTNNKYLVLLLVNIVLLIVGTFLNTTSALILLVPVLAPLAARLGINPIHMGVVVVLNLCLGMLTPPVGTVLFVTANVAKMSVTRLVKAIWPAFMVLCIALLIVTYVPWISTFIPSFF